MNKRLGKKNKIAQQLNAASNAAMKPRIVGLARNDSGIIQPVAIAERPIEANELDLHRIKRIFDDSTRKRELIIPVASICYGKNKRIPAMVYRKPAAEFSRNLPIDRIQKNGELKRVKINSDILPEGKKLMSLHPSKGSKKTLIPLSGNAGFSDARFARRLKKYHYNAKGKICTCSPENNTLRHYQIYDARTFRLNPAIKEYSTSLEISEIVGITSHVPDKLLTVDYLYETAYDFLFELCENYYSNWQEFSPFQRDSKLRRLARGILGRTRIVRSGKAYSDYHLVGRKKKLTSKAQPAGTIENSTPDVDKKGKPYYMPESQAVSLLKPEMILGYTETASRKLDDDSIEILPLIERQAIVAKHQKNNRASVKPEPHYFAQAKALAAATQEKQKQILDLQRDKRESKKFDKLTTENFTKGKVKISDNNLSALKFAILREKNNSRKYAMLCELFKLNGIASLSGDILLSVID